jgi:hypothetical protein
MFEELTKGNMRRTRGFTGEAAYAFCGVKIRHRILIEASGRFFSPETDTAPWRIVFITRQLVCGTGSETETAVGAIRKGGGIGLRIAGARFFCGGEWEDRVHGVSKTS